MLRFVPLFLSSTLISLNYGALIYLNSSFLGDHFSKGIVSLFYLIGALGNITLFLLAPRLLNRFSKEGLYFLALVITATATFSMTVSNSALSAALSFVAYASFLFTVYYFLDIFLEEASTDGRTGSIRGIYYAFVNGGIALGPLMVAVLSKGELLRPVYYAATATLIIPSLIAAFLLWRGPERLWQHKRSLTLPFKSLWHKRNLRAVTLARFVLEAFFAIMVIYTPLYLHNNMGFEWSELGIIFTVMLLPFVILEWPAGEAADRWWGEKEMMTLGFFLTGTMLLVMPFLGKSFSSWLIVLLVSRIGASLIEITTESYFFKKITAAETGFLAIFRITRPFALIFGAAIGALTLGVFSFEKIFFVTAIIVLFGMKESLHLKDTL